MKTAQQILEEAWDLLQQPGVWIKGDYARTVEGLPSRTQSEEAACFCSVGAICRVAKVNPGDVVFDVGTGEAFKAHHLLRTAAGGFIGSIPNRNDEANSVQDLAPMWERAIQLAKEQS